MELVLEVRATTGHLSWSLVRPTMALSGPQVEKQHRLNVRSQVDAVSSCFIQVPLIAKTLLNSKVIDIWSMACVSVEPSEKFMEYGDAGDACWSTSARCTKAELILGHPIFPGESGVDQLVEIIKAHTASTATQRHHPQWCFIHKRSWPGVGHPHTRRADGHESQLHWVSWRVVGCGPKGLVETTLAGFSTLALMAYHYAYY